jgi:cholesterol oxidase
VLAAGTFGSTYLLLRNKVHLPLLSGKLGSRFSGNGDLLTFLFRARDNGRVRPLHASRGPVITSMIRIPDRLDGGIGRGYYVQDAGYPPLLNWLAESVDLPSRLARLAGFTARRLLSAVLPHRTGVLSREISDLFYDGVLSNSSLPLLGMGRDIPDGVMRLRDGRLDVDWTTRTSLSYFSRMRATMRGISDVLGGEYADNPLWLGKRTIIVHPLGGAPIGSHRGEGVCDPYGQVFGYDGLYVADGAALPGPVGVNPAFTIAALADRLCDRVLESPAHSEPADSKPAGTHSHGGVVRAATAVPAEEGPAGTAALRFTERMTGRFALGELEPAVGGEFTVELTVRIADMDRFIADPRHEAAATGWAECADLGGMIAVRRGWVNLLVPGTAADRRQMLYRLHLCGTGGEQWTLVGQKDLVDDPGLDVWPDTTTLVIRLLPGHVPQGQDAKPLGAGVLRIRKRDFLRQLSTLRADGPDPAGTVAKFGMFFLGRLWDQYAALSGTGR